MGGPTAARMGTRGMAHGGGLMAGTSNKTQGKIHRFCHCGCGLLYCGRSPECLRAVRDQMNNDLVTCTKCKREVERYDEKMRPRHWGANADGSEKKKERSG